MYRYRYEGPSHLVMERFEQHKEKLGDIYKVVAKRYQGYRKGELGKYPFWKEVLFLYGTKGTARFTGVCWSYSGEGPRTTYKLLKAIGVSEDEAKYYAFQSVRRDKMGNDWVLERRWVTPIQVIPRHHIAVQRTLFEV